VGDGEGDVPDEPGEPLGDGVGERDGDGDGVGRGAQPGVPGVSSTVCRTPTTSTSSCL
jgi:hypothetical protein